MGGESGPGRLSGNGGRHFAGGRVWEDEGRDQFPATKQHRDQSPGVLPWGPLGVQRLLWYHGSRGATQGCGRVPFADLRASQVCCTGLDAGAVLDVISSDTPLRCDF